jgi:4-hydroxybenzoate polyprenyltransferase
MGFGSYVSAYLKTSRSEYLLAEIPGLLTIFFMGATSLGQLFSPLMWEGAAVFILLYFMGFIINAYTDQEIDRNYTIFKNKIPDAVAHIGRRNIEYLIAGQIAGAFLISSHISYVMGSLLPVALVAVGTFFGVGYSLPPLHFKVRGWLHAVSLILSAFLVPACFLLFIVAGTIAPAPMVIIIGFSLLHYGIAFANQAIDYLEDKAGGVQSPPVRWGMERSLGIALVFIFAGMALCFGGVYWYLVQGHASVLGLTGVPLLLVLVPVILAGYYIPVAGLYKMYRATITRPIEEAVRYMKDICHYNVWQASGITGLMFAVAILFFGAMLG